MSNSTNNPPSEQPLDVLNAEIKEFEDYYSDLSTPLDTAHVAGIIRGLRSALPLLEAMQATIDALTAENDTLKRQNQHLRFLTPFPSSIPPADMDTDKLPAVDPIDEVIAEMSQDERGALWMIATKSRSTFEATIYHTLSFKKLVFAMELTDLGKQVLARLGGGQ